MGLAEKRVLEEYKKKFDEQLRPTLARAAGLTLDVEVVWADILKELSDTSADELEEYVLEVFAKPVIASLESICADSLGRGLITPALKKVRFCCSADISAYPAAFSFGNGVLQVDHSRRKTHAVLDRAA